MANLFLISDTHFGHANVLTFKDGNGEMLRPMFRDTNHMDETIIHNWNSIVKPSDHVYHLGDVAIYRRIIPVVKRLNGHKRLIFGNHDIFAYEEYAAAGFEKLMGMRVLDGMIFTHVPIHTQNLGRFKVNVHGHTHDKVVKLDNGHPDPRYVNVCVEKTNYCPVALEDLKKRL